jgi:hypothetical protein
MPSAANLERCLRFREDLMKPQGKLEFPAACRALLQRGAGSTRGAASDPHKSSWEGSR